MALAPVDEEASSVDETDTIRPARIATD